MTDHPSARWRSVPELLDTRAAESPEAPAASFPGGESSYREVAESSLRSARRLHAAGIGPGDRVGILLREGREEYVSLGIGAMRLGAMCVPVNARNKVHELSYVMRHAGLSLLLTSEEFMPLVSGSERPEGFRAVVVGADPEFEAGGDGVSPGAVAELQEGVGRDDPALLLYTSGTTANPKGCLLHQSNLLAVGENCAIRLKMTAADRFWTPLPLFHVGGWQSLMTAWARGGCFSHAGMFEATAALDQLERERCTVAFPAFELIWMGVLGHPRFPEADLGALRIVINVGVRERMVQMQEALPQATQVSCFGATESCGSMCMGEATDSLESRTTTSGRPLPGMEVRVLDPATGAEQLTGVPGELLFRGITRFAGYYDDPENTAATIDEDGWFHTGDLVKVLEDGTVSFQSRLKDMLKVGGENVSAAEIEGFLITHPAVDMAVAVPAPDARYGEVPCAYVQLAAGAEATEEELIEYCMGSIATYKIPRYVRIVDEFPTTASAKVQKFVLRDRIAAELQEHGITEAPKLVAKR